MVNGLIKFVYLVKKQLKEVNKDFGCYEFRKLKIDQKEKVYNAFPSIDSLRIVH